MNSTANGMKMERSMMIKYRQSIRIWHRALSSRHKSWPPEIVTRWIRYSSRIAMASIPRPTKTSWWKITIKNVTPRGHHQHQANQCTWGHVQHEVLNYMCNRHSYLSSNISPSTIISHRWEIQMGCRLTPLYWDCCPRKYGTILMNEYSTFSCFRLMVRPHPVSSD